MIVGCNYSKKGSTTNKSNQFDSAYHNKMQRRTDSIYTTPESMSIHSKHLEWDIETCYKIATKKVWIGMTLTMLEIERGDPNHTNVSNYGDENEYQWCWDNYTPSCFYGKSNRVITAYN